MPAPISFGRIACSMPKLRFLRFSSEAALARSLQMSSATLASRWDLGSESFAKTNGASAAASMLMTAEWLVRLTHGSSEKSGIKDNGHQPRRCALVVQVGGGNSVAGAAGTKESSRDPLNRRPRFGFGRHPP